MARAAYALHFQQLTRDEPELMAEIIPHEDDFLRFLVKGPEMVARIHGMPPQQHEQLTRLFPQTWLRLHGNVVQELTPKQQKMTLRRLGAAKFKSYWIRLQAEVFVQFLRQGLDVVEP